MLTVTAKSVSHDEEHSHLKLSKEKKGNAKRFFLQIYVQQTHFVQKLPRVLTEEDAPIWLLLSKLSTFIFHFLSLNTKCTDLNSVFKDSN